MGKLHLEVVTPKNVLVSQQVDSVVAPGSLGEFGVLPGHIPFLSGLQPGELRYSIDNRSESIAVSGGFAEVLGDTVSVLVDAAERAHEIDIERARMAMERAKERIAKARGEEDIDFARAEAALRRALVRIKVSEKTV